MMDFHNGSIAGTSAGDNSTLFSDEVYFVHGYSESYVSKVPFATGKVRQEVKKTEVILKIVILGFIIVMGVLGNLFIIIIVGKDRRLHRPPFYYLISLSVSGLSRTLFCLPFIMASLVEGSIWTHGDLACTLLAFANTFFVFSSVVSLLAIALDRHLSIVYSHFHRRRSRGLMNLAIVVIGWLVSFAVSFPPVFGMGTYTYIKEESQCTFKHKQYRKNDTFGFLLVLSAVLIGTLLLYIRIFFFLRKHRKMRPLEREPARSNNWTFFGPGANGPIQLNWMNGVPLGPPNQIPTVMQNLSQATGRFINLRPSRNEHLTRLFFVVTVIFDILWIPYVIQSYITIFGDRLIIPVILRTISAWLTYFQVCVCPIIFICSNAKFRKVLTSSVSNNYRRDQRSLE